MIEMLTEPPCVWADESLITPTAAASSAHSPSGTVAARPQSTGRRVRIVTTPTIHEFERDPSDDNYSDDSSTYHDAQESQGMPIHICHIYLPNRCVNAQMHLQSGVMWKGTPPTDVLWQSQSQVSRFCQWANCPSTECMRSSGRRSLQQPSDESLRDPG